MDSIFSVRINEELKEKFLKMAQDQGINNKELMEIMVKDYELNEAKNTFISVQNDIDELQGLTKRMVDIYLNMLEKNKIKSLEIDNLFKEELASKDENIKRLTEEKGELEQSIKEMKDQLSNKEKEILKEKEENKKNLNTLKEIKELSLMLKEKNSFLSEQLQDYKKLQDENKTLLEEKGLLENEKANYILTLSNLQKEIDSIEKEKVKNQENHKKEIENLTKEYNENIIKKEEALTFNFSKELLEKETYYRDQLWNEKISYEEKISKLKIEKEDLYMKFNELMTKGTKS